MTKIRALGLAGLVFGLAFAAVPAQADPRPIAVELFTSQACSSCPPADAMLAELARRRDVLALGFHVSYWDGPGWKDPLSSAAATERQMAYARRFNGGQVYTPEMVVDGTRDVVGSDRAAVMAALSGARPPAAASIAFAADRHSVTIGSGAGKGDVLLVRFVQRRTTDIAGGENAGRTAEDANAVLSLTTLGSWDGAARRFAIGPPARGEGLAVLVQADDGRMLGAAWITAPTDGVVGG